MKTLLAIDPGTTQSGWVKFYDRVLVTSGTWDNKDILGLIQSLPAETELAIEMIASYGMPVGKETFQTILWIGRFQQVYHSPDDVVFVGRKQVTDHLCNGHPKAKDSNVRQALIDLFPPTGGGKTPQIGIKANRGPLYGVTGDAWAALGVAATVRGLR